ncbi:MAG: hypothetical protein NWE96_06665 [Candidatus Bathyarchaeota archaeon]|nr:hypothetical protein [Candidatus Bathyarchaeota archaeon]
MSKLSIPKLEIISKNIEVWIKENFIKAVAQPSTKSDFKFGKIDRITRVWKNDDYWIVDAFIEYSFTNQKIKTFTFQVDSEGQVVGFNFNEPTNSKVSL